MNARAATYTDDRRCSDNLELASCVMTGMVSCKFRNTFPRTLVPSDFKKPEKEPK
jgi:hypothetical protein